MLWCANDAKKNTVKLGNKLVGLVLLGAAAGSSALTLGRARGSVVLGQPLSLAVEVRIGQADDASSQCFRADVFHGDTPVDASRVRIVVQPPDPGSENAIVRLRSSAVVDEPVVGVVLHALCGAGGTRRYDFLPEFPAELAASAAPVVAPTPPIALPSIAPAAPPVASVPAPAPVTRSAPPPPRPRAAAPARPPAGARSPAAAPAAAKAPRPAQQAKAAAPAAVGSTPRLTLDAPVRSTGLQSSPQIPAAPLEDAKARDDAAALWRAMQMTPEEIVTELRRLGALEAQYAARAAQPVQPSAAERELRARLEAAERRLDEADKGRVDILLLYGLLALLLLAIGVAAFFWHRARAASLAAHWSGPAAEPSVTSTGTDAPFTFRPASVAKASLADEFSDSEPASAVGAFKHSGLDPAAAVAAVFSHESRPEAAIDASRPVRPDEFFDVQQHADFFVSLGQYEQAIEVLEQHLREHQDMSPLGFLELFRIYRQTGRQEDYEPLRARFESRFNAHVPSFAAFADEGLGLEDYPATLLSIETAWGDMRVLDTIEANLLRHPGDVGRRLDLAAYRDLLLLYGIAQAVFVPEGTSRPASVFGQVPASAPVPASVSAMPAAAAAAGGSMIPELDLELDLVPESGPSPLGQPTNVGQELDLDLSEPVPPAAAPLQMVDIDLDMFELEPPGAATPATPAPSPAPVEFDSGMIDFDLFDPDTEERIAPKSTR